MPWQEVTDPTEIAAALAAQGGARGGPKLKADYAMGANGVAAPIPGTPEAQKAKDAAAARASELRQLRMTAETANSLIPRAVGMGEAFSSWVQPTTGFLGHVMAQFPGTAAYNFERALDPVKANIGFDRLAQMRAQSPTGAALGSVSDSENRMLQATMASLDPGQDVDQVKAGLMRVRDEYRNRLKERGGLLSPRPAAAPAPRKVVNFADLP